MNESRGWSWLIWIAVIILHGLTLWLFDRPLLTTPPEEDKPLFVSLVEDPPAAAGSPEKTPSAQPSTQNTSLSPHHVPKPVPIEKKADPQPAPLVVAKALPNAPVSQPTPPSAEKSSNQAEKPTDTTNNGGQGGGGKGQTGGSGAGVGNGTAATGGTSSGGPVSVSASQLRCRHCAQPRYLPVAQERGYQGTVRILIIVSQSGQMQQASLSRSSGYAMLDEAALAAAKASSFSPYVVNGEARSAKAIIPYNFYLRGSPVRKPEKTAPDTQEASS